MDTVLFIDRETVPLLNFLFGDHYSTYCIGTSCGMEQHATTRWSVGWGDDIGKKPSKLESGMFVAL